MIIVDTKYFAKAASLTLTSILTTSITYGFLYFALIFLATNSEVAADSANMLFQYKNFVAIFYGLIVFLSINNAANQSSEKVKSRADSHGVSEESVKGEISKVHTQTSGAFNDIKAKNTMRNQQMEEANRQRLEEAEQKAKNAQPVQRAKNVAGYVSEGLESAANLALNKLKPPKDR